MLYHERDEDPEMRPMAITESEQTFCTTIADILSEQVHIFPPHPSWGRFPVPTDSTGDPT